MILFDSEANMGFGSASLFSDVIRGCSGTLGSTPETGYLFRLIHDPKHPMLGDDKFGDMPAFGICRLRPGAELAEALSAYAFPGGMFISFKEQEDHTWHVEFHCALISGFVGFRLSKDEMTKILAAIRAVAAEETILARIT